ncbi:hypothetical protein GCM10010172_61340 [Paractinoplanes ferrugineus]|uniref:SCP domain-containing protein n=1 Tax=Paractinoplanes ferrugineus TaxID=113564 RepID=A0A919MG75_9ACTN|nr:hypothetical protein Afe05nite_63780 [Actinoplanes ferrugineus]
MPAFGESPQSRVSAGATVAARPDDPGASHAEPGRYGQPGRAGKPRVTRTFDDNDGRGDGSDVGDTAADVPRKKPARKRPAETLPAPARQAVTSSDVTTNPSARAQQQILALVNLNRRRSGCGSLSLDRRLITAANRHAADMARRAYFAHVSRNGADSGARLRAAGYRWARYGENIARGFNSPWDVVNGWMRSPGHRRNILDCRLHQMGIGLAISRDHTTYWVQDFATPTA